jgi:hypothetical protein
MAHAMLASAVALASWIGCVDTSPVGLEAPPLCVASEPAPEPGASVVFVQGDLRLAGRTVCTGYALTPSIVLTNSVCVVMPVGVAPSDLDRRIQLPSYEGAYVAYSADVNYAAYCDVDAGWEPRERGVFGAWLGDPLAPAQVTVSVLDEGQPVAVSNAREILLPHAHSRCSNSLAALVLAEPLPVPYRPLRLGDGTTVGESVIMSSLNPTGVTPAQRIANIEALTSEATEPGAPARSLILSLQSCYFEPGGGVLAEASRALIALMGYGTGTYCGDPLGKTIATRVAPYQSMLLEAAEAAADTLHLEPSPLIPTPAALPACAAE